MVEIQRIASDLKIQFTTRNSKKYSTKDSQCIQAQKELQAVNASGYLDFYIDFIIVLSEAQIGLLY